MSFTREIARPHLVRCLLAIFLPAILLVPALLISHASGFSLADYHARLMSTPPLMAKAVMNGTLGMIGIGLWGYLMLPPALLALYHKNDFLIERDGQLICLGKIICQISEIYDVHLEERVLKKNLVIYLNNKSINAGNIAMCQDAKSAVDEVKRLKTSNA